MAEKSTAALLADNDNNVVNQTAPESITPGALGSNVLEHVIESMWNRVDDLLTLPQANITKAALATAIGASSLNNRTNGLSINQVLKITDRTDGYPLYVQILSANTISPIGIWVKAGKPLVVFMDYVNGYEGETNPFLGMFDENRNFYTPNAIIIADGTNGAGRVLTSDANGKTTWKAVTNYQSSVLNPAAVSGAAAGKMLGLAGALTPSKSGNVLIIISGEYITDSLLSTTISMRFGTGAAPANGAAATGTQGVVKPLKASATATPIPFCITAIVAMTPGDAYWIDVAAGNAVDGSVELDSVTISAIEQ